MTNIVTKFDSWHVWLEHVEKLPKHSTESNMDRSFYGVPFSVSIDLAYNGWPEGLAEMKSLSGPLIDKLTRLVERPTFNYDVEGQSLDVGAYLNGDPECFLRQSTEIVQGFGTRHLTLVVNIAVSGSVSTDTIIQRGAMLATMVEVLEMADCRVDVWGGLASTQYDKGEMETFFHLKSPEQPLDLARFIFAVAHPSSLRRLGFREYLHNGHDTSIAKPKPLTAITGDIEMGEILTAVGVSPERATSILMDALKANGVTFREEFGYDLDQ